MCDARVPTTWTDEEPRARFFSWPNCSVAEMDLGEGNYADLRTLGTTPGDDDIDSVIVPPHMTVTLFADPYFNGNSRQLQPNERVGDLHNPLISVDANQTSSIIVNRVKSWQQFRTDCCKGIGNPDLCKNFWGPSNGSSCDSYMQQFCRQNPTDPSCSCLNSEIPNAQCFDTNCQKTGYKTNNMKSISNCPDFIQCNQYLSLSDNAKQNIVNGNQLQQNCTRQTGAAQSPATVPMPQPDPSTLSFTETEAHSTGYYLLLLLIILIMVGAGIGGLVWALTSINDSEDKGPEPGKE